MASGLNLAGPSSSATPPARRRAGGRSTAGLVLGVLSLAFSRLPPLALLLALLGLTFSAVSKGQNSRYATAGMILNIMGLIVSLVLIARCVSLWTSEMQALGWEIRCF